MSDKRAASVIFLVCGIWEWEEKRMGRWARLPTLRLPEAHKNTFQVMYMFSILLLGCWLQRSIHMQKLLKLYALCSLLYVDYTSLEMFLRCWIVDTRILIMASLLYGEFIDHFSCAFLTFLCWKKILFDIAISCFQIQSKFSEEQKITYNHVHSNFVDKKKNLEAT